MKIVHLASLSFFNHFYSEIILNFRKVSKVVQSFSTPFTQIPLMLLSLKYYKIYSIDHFLFYYLSFVPESSPGRILRCIQLSCFLSVFQSVSVHQYFLVSYDLDIFEEYWLARVSFNWFYLMRFLMIRLRLYILERIAEK